MRIARTTALSRKVLRPRPVLVRPYDRATDFTDPRRGLNSRASLAFLREIEALLGRLGIANVVLTVRLVDIYGIDADDARRMMISFVGDRAIWSELALLRFALAELSPERVPGTFRRNLAGALAQVKALERGRRADRIWADVREMTRHSADIAVPDYILYELTARPTRRVAPAAPEPPCAGKPSGNA